MYFYHLHTSTRSTLRLFVRVNPIGLHTPNCTTLITPSNYLIHVSVSGRSTNSPLPAKVFSITPLCFASRTSHSLPHTHCNQNDDCPCPPAAPQNSPKAIHPPVTCPVPPLRCFRAAWNTCLSLSG